MKRLVKINTDIHNRLEAILIVNGEVYEGYTHQKALTQYLLDNNIGTLNNNLIRTRITQEINENNSTLVNEDLKLIQDNIHQLAYAHMMEDGTINLETDSLYGISKNDTIILLHKKYPRIEIYDDNNYDPIREEFKKIARKRLIKGEFFNSYKSGDETIDCFKDPTLKEWREITKGNGYFRAIIHENGELYIWSSELLHESAIEKFNIPDGLHIDGTKTWISFYLTPEIDIEYIHNAFKNSKILFTYINTDATIEGIDTDYYGTDRDEIYNELNTVQDILDFK